MRASESTGHHVRPRGSAGSGASGNTQYAGADAASECANGARSAAHICRPCSTITASSACSSPTAIACRPPSSTVFSLTVRSRFAHGVSMRAVASALSALTVPRSGWSPRAPSTALECHATRLAGREVKAVVVGREAGRIDRDALREPRGAHLDDVAGGVRRSGPPTCSRVPARPAGNQNASRSHAVRDEPRVDHLRDRRPELDTPTTDRSSARTAPPRRARARRAPATSIVARRAADLDLAAAPQRQLEAAGERRRRDR